MTGVKERKKYYSFKIEFTTQEEYEKFKNYMHHIKTGHGKSIPVTAMEMLHLHKNQKKER